MDVVPVGGGATPDERRRVGGGGARPAGGDGRRAGGRDQRGPATDVLIRLVLNAGGRWIGPLLESVWEGDVPGGRGRELAGPHRVPAPSAGWSSRGDGGSGVPPRPRRRNGRLPVEFEREVAGGSTRARRAEPRPVLSGLASFGAGPVAGAWCSSTSSTTPGGQAEIARLTELHGGAHACCCSRRCWRPGSTTRWWWPASWPSWSTRCGRPRRSLMVGLARAGRTAEAGRDVPPLSRCVVWARSSAWSRASSCSRWTRRLRSPVSRHPVRLRPGRAPRRIRLPQPTSTMVGRDDEQRRLGEAGPSALRARHAGSGSGGVGKTRVALEVARARRFDLFADGAWSSTWPR